MANLTENRLNTNYQEGGVVEYNIKSGSTIYLGALTMLVDGLLVRAANTAGAKFAGVATFGEVTGATGNKTKMLVHRAGSGKVVTVASAGLTQADVGKDVYVTDDQTVTKAANNVKVGVIQEVISATECRIII